jgi:hypothetical protein
MAALSSRAFGTESGAKPAYLPGLYHKEFDVNTPRRDHRPGCFGSIHEYAHFEQVRS